MTNAVLRGRPDAGNPHDQFDEGEVASAKPRRGSLLCKKLMVAAGIAVVVGCAMFAPKSYEGVDLAPDDVEAHDLTPLADLLDCPGEPIVVVDKDGIARLSIVRAYGRDEEWAAKQLQTTIFEMTGVKPAIVVERSKDKPATNSPAFFIGATAAAEKAGLAAPTDNKGAFAVTAKDGSVYFLGRSDYAVTDWCERELGVRYYWPEQLAGDKNAKMVYGKCTVKTKGLAVRPRAWTDRPVFGARDNWPYESYDWNRWAKGGAEHRGGVNVHAPHGWWKETNALDHVEIFALNVDGKRPTSPLLCYGNPKTLEYYKMRIRKAIAEKTADPKARDSSGGIVNFDKKVITVSQWDCGVYCACEHCKKLFDEKLGGLGSGSPIIWGYFTKELAKWVKREYPDWMISILPYCNTCLVTPGVDFTAEGNVEAELCTMPGVAMMKNKRCKQYEEDMIRAWEKCTGRKVLNWHYSCWPAEYTAAPYVYGETIKRHYQDMRHDVVGSFLNGGYDQARFSLSIYVWMRCLWNPDVDVQAIYDGFAERMFGKAAKPMRKLIRMQEEGWNRQWNSNLCSVKNVYGISYPPADVQKMKDLLAEAEQLAAGDEKASARLAWYKSGFEKFFQESEQNASGVAFPKLSMKKAATPPVLDGKLDDACWGTAESLPFVSAQSNWSGVPGWEKTHDPKKPADYATDVKVVWVAGEGVVFGFKCTEPQSSAMKAGVEGDVWDQDNIEVFIDASGAGEGHYYHILADAYGRMKHKATTEWKPMGIVCKTFIGNGFWSMELFVPFSDMEKFPNRQLPTTSANGCLWNGNMIRFRVGDCKLPKEKRAEGSHSEISRLNTRFNKWNKDPAAFSDWQFVE